MEAGARQQRVHTGASRASRGGPAQSRGWRRGEAAGGACVHPPASYNNPQQLPAALHRDLTARLQMSPLPATAIQLPPPKPLLPEGRAAEWGHKQGLTSPMLTQHPATAQARGAVKGWWVLPGLTTRPGLRGRTENRSPSGRRGEAVVRRELGAGGRGAALTSWSSASSWAAARPGCWAARRPARSSPCPAAC